MLVHSYLAHSSSYSELLMGDFFFFHVTRYLQDLSFL